MLILIGGIVALMMCGFPVPFAFLTVNCVAAYFPHGRHRRHHPGARQRHRLDLDLHAGGDPDVPPDGGTVLPHQDGAAGIRHPGDDAWAGAGTSQLSRGRRRNAVFGADRLVDGQHRHARLAARRRDGPPRLQDPHESRPDHGHRQPGHDHPAVGAGGAARKPRQYRHRRTADRRLRPGTPAGDALCLADLCAGENRSDLRAAIRSRTAARA